ncbi:MAG: penicillin acylase family protein [Armatimonadetes bacterium]|nr:penicillin acylase family protein [Armatimonadota bacterium]
MLATLALAVATLLSQQTQAPAPIERDEFGVPHIFANSWEDGFYHAGYAVAEDRLWQMEQSRRLARGKLAEVFGKDFAASDRDILKTAYTDQELQQQFDKLAPRAKLAFDSYAKGVNAYIDAATKKGSLPPGYAAAGFRPEKWTVLDSAAITIRLFQLFGRRDAGEIRNWALLTYLSSQPVKEQALDAFDDFLWQNDPASPTTVLPEDDLGADARPRFPKLTRAITEKHLTALPKVGLFDLLPALKLAQAERTSTLVAQKLGAPFKAGSYAIVVGKERSATGWPMLLNGPQMGFFNPAIVHELSMAGPGLNVVGMDVPGAPGVAIGHTAELAWGLTSGVADTDDVFLFKASGADGYLDGEQTKKLTVVRRTLKIKGQPDETVEQKRTDVGPVIHTAKGFLFSNRSASWMRELDSIQSIYGLLDAREPKDLDGALSHATMNFNFFFAFHGGPIGYRYLGLIPDRAEGWDPRLPVMGSPESAWKGFISSAQMPRVDNPKGGLITNWNNKPASWFPNFDSPAWGRLFRVDALNQALDKPKLSLQDLESAIWTIARTEATAYAFMPLIKQQLKESDGEGAVGDAIQYLRAFDGRQFEGSVSATVFDAFIDALRNEVFLGTTGNFLSPGVFRLAAQPSVILNALQGNTEVKYLKGRSVAEVFKAAATKAASTLEQRLGADAALWRFRPGSIPVPGEPPIPYNNRGSYIQVVELRATVRGRNVLPPGVAESGPHSKDQAPLSRAWQFKPMKMRPF